MTIALYISAFVPDRTAGHAGGQAAFANLARLREQNEKVNVIVCTTEAVEDTDDLCIIHQSLPAFLQAAMRHLRGSLPQRLAGAIIHSRLNINFIEAVRSEIERTRPDLVFCDFSQTHLVGAIATKQVTPRPALHFCLHDVFAQRCLRTGHIYERWLTNWVMQEEEALVSQGDVLLTLNNKDAHLLESLYLARDIKILPFRPPAWVARVDRRKRVSGRVLFFGNFAREENREAAWWFVRICGPLVRQMHPNFHCILAGTLSERLRDELGSPNWVTATGFLNDPSEEFSKAAICIAPLERGAGVKFKVLEALAASTPVLATPVAAEGIDANKLLEVAPREDFADVLVHLL